MGIKSFIVGLGVGTIAGVVGVVYFVKKNKTGFARITQDILLEAMGFDHSMVRRSQVRYSSYGHRYKTYDEITFTYIDKDEAKAAYLKIVKTINNYGSVRLYDIEHSFYQPSLSYNRIISARTFGWTDIHDLTLVGNRIKALPPVSLKEVDS